MKWTRESVFAWARENLPNEFRTCHVGFAARSTLGHWTHGQAVIFNLKRWGMIERVCRLDIPQHPKCGHVRHSRGVAYRLIFGALPTEEEILEARILMRIDEPREDPRVQRLRDLCE